MKEIQQNGVSGANGVAMDVAEALKVIAAAAGALLAKVDEDTTSRWRFVNERESLRAALSRAQVQP